MKSLVAIITYPFSMNWDNMSRKWCRHVAHDAAKPCQFYRKSLLSRRVMVIRPCKALASIDVKGLTAWRLVVTTSSVGLVHTIFLSPACRAYGMVFKPFQRYCARRCGTSMRHRSIATDRLMCFSCMSLSGVRQDMPYWQAFSAILTNSTVNVKNTRRKPFTPYKSAELNTFRPDPSMKHHERRQLR